MLSIASQIESNRRKEIDDSNEKRNEFAAREKEIEVHRFPGAYNVLTLSLGYARTNIIPGVCPLRFGPF